MVERRFGLHGYERSTLDYEKQRRDEERKFRMGSGPFFDLYKTSMRTGSDALNAKGNE